MYGIESSVEYAVARLPLLASLFCDHLQFEVCMYNSESFVGRAVVRLLMTSFLACRRSSDVSRVKCRVLSTEINC